MLLVIVQGTIDPYADEDDDMWDGGADNGRPEWQQGLLDKQRERYASGMDLMGPNQGTRDHSSSYHNAYVYIPAGLSDQF